MLQPIQMLDRLRKMSLQPSLPLIPNLMMLARTFLLGLIVPLQTTISELMVRTLEISSRTDPQPRFKLPLVVDRLWIISLVAARSKMVQSHTWIRNVDSFSGLLFF